MDEFILFMHDDATDASIAQDDGRWEAYLARLRGSGQFDGGSSIGPGLCLRHGHPDRASSAEVTGFLRVRAPSLEEARRFLAGNPVYEAGGTVEIRALLRDG